MATLHDQLEALIRRAQADTAALNPAHPGIVGALHALTELLTDGRDIAIIARRLQGDTWAQLGEEIGVDPRNMPARYLPAVREAIRRAAGGPDQ